MKKHTLLLACAMRILLNLIALLFRDTVLFDALLVVRRKFYRI